MVVYGRRDAGILRRGSLYVETKAGVADGLGGSRTECADNDIALLEVGEVLLERLHTAGTEEDEHIIVQLLVGLEVVAKVIFADEPTASLDHENAFNIMKILKEYSKERLVIVVTHDRTVLTDVDIMIEMWDGKISSISGQDR